MKAEVAMSDTLAERVMTIIAETQHIPRERISVDSSFEDLGMDSLGSLSLVYELEEEFNISIPNEEAMTLRTVRQAIESLKKLLPEDAGEAGTPV